MWTSSIAHLFHFELSARPVQDLGALFRVGLCSVVPVGEREGADALSALDLLSSEATESASSRRTRASKFRPWLADTHGGDQILVPRVYKHKVKIVVCENKVVLRRHHSSLFDVGEVEAGRWRVFVPRLLAFPLVGLDEQAERNPVGDEPCAQGFSFLFGHPEKVRPQTPSSPWVFLQEVEEARGVPKLWRNLGLAPPRLGDFVQNVRRKPLQYECTSGDFGGSFCTYSGTWTRRTRALRGCFATA